MSEDMKESLIGEAVIHSTGDVGTVVSITEAEKAIIEVGYQQQLDDKWEGSLGEFEELLVDESLSIERRLVHTVPLEHFVGSRVWSLSPDSDATDEMLDNLVDAETGIVIPTGSPKNAREYKDGIDNDVLEFLNKYNNFIPDDDLLNVERQLAYIFDSQLSWYMAINHKESQWEYTKRLMRLEENNNSWSQSIILSDGVPGYERIFDLIIQIADIRHRQGGEDVIESICLIVMRLDARILRYNAAISKLVRLRTED